MWEMILGAGIMLVGIIFGAALMHVGVDNGRKSVDE
jgi:hypothetical protein